MPCLHDYGSIINVVDVPGFIEALDMDLGRPGTYFGYQNFNAFDSLPSTELGFWSSCIMMNSLIKYEMLHTFLCCRFAAYAKIVEWIAVNLCMLIKPLNYHPCLISARNK
ncbi:hypothetical protein AVEN_53162-1 [Araneus ventricosus]|uniref:Uncharacterized protein n=1 Tax=Araneus ventricosus TaxID=182803 RepID=A0A4Y2A937_ARAVE|nr:hypothetical protein AVEN_53162-1 [Araneus ventricosus]